MSKVASIFSDIFGKDVVYNPLTPSEMAAIDLPHAELYAQMCQFLADDRSNHDVDLTDAVMFPRRPQLFRDWILTHSDEEEFERVGLTADAAPITTITVFGCTSLEGTAVVKGLLKDTRKEYKIIATSRDIAQSRAQNLKSLDPDRVTLVQCDFDDVHSCAAALDGAEGAFLVTDFYEGMPDGDPEIEEQRAKNVIDACADAKEVKHLVFSTHESVDEMNKRMKLGMNHPIAALEKGKGRGDDDARALKRSILPHLDAKARAAAYARTKNISCTFVLMPYYVEKMMELLAPKVELDEETGEESLVLEVPDTELRMMTISAEEMGPAVANIFDSYQVSFQNHYCTE